MSGGALETSLAAMGHFPDDPSVQISACALLAQLATGNPDSQISIGNAGAMPQRHTVSTTTLNNHNHDLDPDSNSNPNP